MALPVWDRAPTPATAPARANAGCVDRPRVWRPHDHQAGRPSILEYARLAVQIVLLNRSGRVLLFEGRGLSDTGNTVRF